MNAACHPDHSFHAVLDNECDPLIAQQVGRYRKQRRQRRMRETQRCERRWHRSEADELIRFARIWAPYGGAPDDETFPMFGITGSQFTDRLWRAVQDVECDSNLVVLFAATYPRLNISKR